MDFTFPPKELKPNFKCHWGKKHRAAKAYKDLVMWEAVGNKPELPEGNIYLKVTIYPPDRRQRDEDNIVASLKYLYDGIAALWGVNDHRFRCRYEWGEVVKGGKINVKVLPI